MNTAGKAAFFIILISVAVSSGIVGCKGSVNSSHLFSYPPDSLPHDDRWTYLGEVMVSSKERGPLTRKSRKSVVISVVDRNKKVYLSDQFKFECANIESSITWEDFKEIQIVLSEVGNKFAEDSYNQQLVKKGPHRLAGLKYVYDPTAERFKRTY